ncbi:RHS repeat-associated core domain-containing protein [Halomonas huangheensis]|uniref:RHS repeat-associated core domain-containing protein n=2 Tax=Halomonas huangheensis TaxID=1178482 RepID=UPI000702ABB8|nr:hypothetical protein AR456_09140 [Halomonas huangheensis]
MHEGDQVTTFKRDSMGRLLERHSQRPGLLPVSSQFAYDALGHLVRAANESSETHFHFDAADNLIAEVQRHQLPNGSEYSAVTRHTHDALGNRETTTLPDGQQIAWLRYGSGHVHAMALNQQELIGFERDDLHREVRRHQRGRLVESRYDPAGRLIAQQIKPGDQGQTIQRQWHYADNGLLTAIDDSLRGHTEYGYDPLGRLRKAAAPGLEEQFAFDPAGNLIDPQDSSDTDYTDATRWRGERTSDHLDSEPHQHIRVDYPNAPKLSPAMGNLLKRYAGTHYHYDDFGNLVRRISPNGATWQYRYNPEHRLIEAAHYAQAPAAGDTAEPETRARYAYDSLGRRIWKQVEHQGKLPELTVFTWDGDLLQSEESFQGSLPSMWPSDPLELVRENPERQRSTPIAKRLHRLDTVAMAPQRRVSYLFEPGSFVPAAKLEARYEAVPQATGSGTVLYTDYRLSEPTLYYFQTDHLGTPLEVTDSDGNLAWVGHYRAWGQLRKANDGNSDNITTDNPFRFQGQYHDEETGLHYNRHRYYDPEIGRFITQDPIGLMGGENLYMYAPNPTGWVDPLGLAKCNCSAYEVGAFDDLQSRSQVGDGLDIHHVAQKHPAGQVIPGYDLKTAPSMAVPSAEHRAIPTLRGEYSGSPRELLAKDVRDLRNYTNAPNSAIQDLISLNKEMYPNSF